MFTKGSRYRNLPESVFLNAKGERFLGKDVRLIPLPENRVMHTVLDGDRLDLLAYKYYGDTTRWWQISDANPDGHFPVDLLDARPTVEELFVLTHQDFNRRFGRLITALKNIGTVRNGLISYFESSAPFESLEIVEPNFLSETIFLIYAPARRAQVLAAIQTENFNYLNSFSFAQASPNIAESFTIDDPEAKRHWEQLLDSLIQTPGVLEVRSWLTEATLKLDYNSNMVQRESLLSLMKKNGFGVDAVPSSRIGKMINIPANQIA
jgi:hypothetical protein